MKKVKRPLKWLATLIAVEMSFVALITIIFDPFYQYHSALFQSEMVLYDRDNQVPGTIRTADYDSVLLGSSMSENCDTDYLDSVYGTNTLKIIRASGSTADLMYYLTQAHQYQDLTNIVWFVDIFALCAPLEVTLYSSDTPRYLHTAGIYDDFTYLFNKDILIKEIPYSLAYSFLDKNTGGNAYNWAEGKVFGTAKAMQAYEKPDEPLPDRFSEEDTLLVDQNVANIVSEVISHPETNYTFVFPPYSLFWWDCGHCNGISSQYFYALEKALSELTVLNNASVYFFQDYRDIVCNPDLYMDMVHYTPDVNQYILEAIVSDKHKVTPKTVDETLASMKDTFNYIINEKIYEFYPKEN